MEIFNVFIFKRLIHFSISVLCLYSKTVVFLCCTTKDFCGK